MATLVGSASYYICWSWFSVVMPPVMTNLPSLSPVIVFSVVDSPAMSDAAPISLGSFNSAAGKHLESLPAAVLLSIYSNMTAFTFLNIFEKTESLYII